MESKKLIAKWLKELDMDGWKVITEYVDPAKVMIDKDIPEEERYFIGIKYDQDSKTAVIYHDRELTEEDIIHELVHARFPYYEEYEVIEASNYLYANNRAKNYMSLKKGNIMQEIGSGYKNLLKSKLGLSSEEDEKVFAERRAICNACPHITKIDTCGLCGCPLEAKTKSKYSECADKKNRRW